MQLDNVGKTTQGLRIGALVCALMLALACATAGGARVAFAEEQAVTEETTAEQPAEEQAATEQTAEEQAAAEAKAAEEQAAAEAKAAEEQAAAAAETAKEEAKLPDKAMSLLGNDLVWFGRDTKLTEYKAANDFLGAGETVTVTDSEIAGSIRLAGRVIKVTGTKVGQSITAAGQDLLVRGGSSTAVALAGNTIEFDGATTGDLRAAGNKVVINGTVTGDVVVECAKLEIGPNANIAGTLSGTVGSEPTINTTATVGKNEIVVEKSKRENQSVTDMIDIRVLIYTTLSCVAVALLAEWLAGGHTVKGASLLKEHPGSFILSGILGTILMPIVIVISCIPIVTAPFSLALLLALGAMSLVSGGFMAALIGRALLPNANRFVTALIFGIIIGLLCSAPYVGAPFRCVALMFMIGYVVCSMRMSMRERKEAAAF